MSLNYLNRFVAITAAVLFISVAVCASAASNVRYESGKIDWVDVQRGELGLSRATPSGIKTTAYRITENSTRVTDSADKKFINITNLRPGEEVSIEVIDGQEGEIVQRIIIGSASALKLQQDFLVEVNARDFANGKLVNLVGPRGPAGPAGSTGEQGLAGAKGAPGVVLSGKRGKQGPVGPKGEQGLTGPRGPAGDIVRGAAGAAGPEGAKGLQGEAGIRGKQGDSLAGYEGPQGAAGPQGKQGLAGNAGAKGPTLYGPSGPVGAAGPQGNQGIAGAQGYQGATAAGTAGLAGNAGISGSRGEKGEAGNQGEAGQVDQWVFYKEFKFNSDETNLNKDNKMLVAEIANYINRNPSLQVGIDGTALKNSDQVLNNKRVNNIRQAFIEAGISSNRIMLSEVGDKNLRREGRISILFATAEDFLSKK